MHTDRLPRRNTPPTPIAANWFVLDEATDLMTPIPWGDGQTILREALLVADHNAYHLGQLVTVRRLLNAWSA